MGPQAVIPRAAGGRGTLPSRSDDEPYAVKSGRGGAPASGLLCCAAMTNPRLRGTLIVLVAGLSLAVLAPREAFAQG
jgi:hypothetical protein